jgi:hypothetical protein
MRTFRKDPDEVLDYTVNWSQRLQANETISSSDWIVDSGITEDKRSMSSTSATIWLSGGSTGTSYTLINRVQTSVGRVYEQHFVINCIDWTE